MVNICVFKSRCRTNISLSSQAFKNPETDDSLIYKCGLLKSKLKVGPPFPSKVEVSPPLLA